MGVALSGKYSKYLFLVLCCIFKCNPVQKPPERLNLNYYFFVIGATVDDNVAGVKAKPELFAQTSKKVPDVNFFYRYFWLLK